MITRKNAANSEPYFGDNYFAKLEEFARARRPKPTTDTHDQWTDDHEVVWWVHRWNQSCTDDGCAIHCPTEHHMKDWPKVMATGTVVVRICEHDYEHPDPDSFAFFERTGRSHMGVHNCDGCCTTRPKRRSGTQVIPSTKSVPAVLYPEGHTHNEWDCEICNPYGLDREDIH
jgi:hypothetical protein